MSEELRVVELSKVAREFAGKQDLLPQISAENADKKLSRELHEKMRMELKPLKLK
jgi:hypothetical protein